MECYEAYKDSGVEWIGEIPAGWDTQSFRWILKRVNREPLDNDEIVTCFRDGEVTLRRNRREDGFTMSDKEIGYQHICKGDFVIHGMDGFAGSMGISDSDGKASPVLMVFQAVGDSDLRYINYLLRLYAWRDVFLSLSTTIRVRSCDLNWNKVAPIPLVLPSPKEQCAIADYLDSKTAEIDALVDYCEREVELLQEYRKAVISEAVTKGLDPNAPMKDSGSQWIDEIPDGWMVVPLKHFSRLITDGVHQTPDYQDEGVPFLSIKDMSRGYLDFSECKYISPQEHDVLSKHANVESGDILFARIGTLGVAVVVRDCPVFDIFVSLGLLKIKHDTINADYLAYCMNSDYYYSYIQTVKAGGGTAAAKFNLGDVSISPVVTPPIEIQQEIVDCLNEKTVEIDSLIRIKQQMADKLREYRRSLISEAVTGKIKVPGV